MPTVQGILILILAKNISHVFKFFWIDHLSPTLDNWIFRKANWT